MQEEIINNSEVIPEVVPTTPSEATVETAATPEAASTIVDKPSDRRYVRKEVGASRGGFKGGSRGGRPARPPREKPEFDSKAIDVRRVTRVVSGGRRFSLHVTMIAGDRNGRVGLGTGKATDTQAAMDKALKSAKKNMIRFKMDNKKSIAHEVRAKYDTSEVWITPNKEKGLIAGSSARVILSLAGLANVTAKFHGGTKNKLNNARATMKALSEVSERA